MDFVSRTKVVYEYESLMKNDVLFNVEIVIKTYVLIFSRKVL